FEFSAHRSGLHSQAVCAAAVEVDEDVAGFGPVAGADDAAVFEFIHDAGGAAVADFEPALEERNAGFVFAADDFNALLDEFLVLFASFARVVTAGGFLELLMDFEFVTGLA